MSHSSRDSRVAKDLARDLQLLGHDIWLDEWEIKVGQSIPSAIETGIAGADFMVVLLSQHAVASSWVDKEWKLAYWDEVNARSVVVLPVRLDDCEIPKLLSPKKYADLSTSYALGFRDLANSIDHYDGISKEDEIARRFQDVSEVFRDRAEFIRIHSYKSFFQNASQIDAIGLSLNEISLNYGSQDLAQLAARRCKVRLLFLDPESEAMHRREQEEGYEEGQLSGLTRTNLHIVARVRRELPDAESRSHLEYRTYATSVYLNLYVIDDRIAILQHYGPWQRGLESPCILLDRAQATGGLFDFYRGVFDWAWSRGQAPEELNA